MQCSFFKALRAPMDRLLQFAARQCCRRQIPRLDAVRAPTLEKKLDVLAGWLDTVYARGAFSGTVLIARSGKICFERHYGFTDVDEAVPLSARASFSLASVSKQFTAMGILLLAREKKLALDDTIARYLPELAGYGKITIKQLLHHTSGVPDHMQLAAEHWNPKNILTTQDMIALFEEYRPPLDFAPGDRFEYSNTGYVLLGEIIARASGTPYAEFMAEEIFKPLRMQDSAAFNLASKECTLRCRVFGLRKRFGCFGRKERCDLNYLDGVFGDAGICASAEDLLRWDTALRDGTLIPCAVYQAAYVSGRLNNGEATGYGYGWEIGPSNVVDHLGEWEGFTSYVRRDLKTHTLLVVLSNLGPSAYVEAMSVELEAFVENMEFSG
jgi:CubicO group peptidase (beta-lactamase class C family)